MNMIAEIENLGVPAEEEQKGRFKIETKDQAIWALRKIAQKKKEQKENQEAARIETSRIMDWLTGENDNLDKECSFFEFLLREYFNTLRQDDPKLKTLKLPHGSLKMRAQQPEFAYDDDLLLPWAKDNLPEAVVVKESTSKTMIKDYLKETGEVIPGVTVTPRPEKFSVEVLD